MATWDMILQGYVVLTMGKANNGWQSSVFLMSEGLGKERIRMKTFTKLQEQPGYQESVSHIPTQSQTIWLLAKEDQCFAIELVNMNLEFSFFFFG